MRKGNMAKSFRRVNRKSFTTFNLGTNSWGNLEFEPLSFTRDLGFQYPIIYYLIVKLYFTLEAGGVWGKLYSQFCLYIF